LPPRADCIVPARAYAGLMKTTLKLAMGAAIAGTLVSLLTRQKQGQGTTTQSAEAQAEVQGPVETLNDSAGTPASATELVQEPRAQGF
jgi:hypothetical protein